MYFLTLGWYQRHICSETVAKARSRKTKVNIANSNQWGRQGLTASGSNTVQHLTSFKIKCGFTFVKEETMI